MQKHPRATVTALGGLAGAAVALLGILLGITVANLTTGGHSEGGAHEQPAGEHAAEH